MIDKEPGDFTVIGLKPVDARHGQLGHLQPGLRRREVPVSFLPGISCRNEKDPVELRLMKRRLAGVEMRDMNWVEGPPENSGAHANEDRAAEASPSGVLG